METFLFEQIEVLRMVKVVTDVGIGIKKIMIVRRDS